MLILKTLTREPNHGYGIAQHIQKVSRNALRIGEGSLYPALQRVLVNGWVAAEWGIFRKQLATEVRDFDFLVAGIGRVMKSA
jgi:PadR family transcriptional regulator PadR